VTLRIVHLSDLHFGEVADLRQIRAVEELVPDLDARVIVISGDISLRSRHGEFQAAVACVRELERTAPVFVIPGNHDVQWWRRPLIPFGRSALYGKYTRYFGPVLAPTLTLPEAVIAGTLTSYGVAWGSLTPRIRDVAVKGHLPKQQIERAGALFRAAAPEQARILVMHHNVMRGDLSQRMGLARWRQAQDRIVASGADIVLCGHDHQEQADLLQDRVVVSCAGTLSTRSRGGRPSVFNRVTVEADAIHVEFYRWDQAGGVFKRSDCHSFPHPRPTEELRVATATV
jgi:3',5'-cyclic AMP phosphodiesterase CpdA